MIDLRSDTVTQPTEAMRAAMAKAPVGDTVFNEDPTIRQLEAKTAALLGKEAAIYVVSGTMANSIAMRLMAGPGDELLMDENAHPHHYEGGGPPAFTGATVRTVQGKNGIFTAKQLEAQLHPDDFYRPSQKGVLLENTQNRGGGLIYPLEDIKEISKLARQHSLRLHLDGARLWNASVASGISVKEYASHFDTVAVCFSKGLGAPVGSVLVGTEEDIEKAWHIRHMLGGTWRQAGILAAGALWALEHNFERLQIDHENAKLLADELRAGGIEIVNNVETNMVYIRDEEPDKLVELAGANGILLETARPGVIRAVTHLQISREDIEATIRFILRHNKEH